MFDFRIEAQAPPAVSVTLQAEATNLKLGTNTKVHVFAQISSNFLASTDQIFSWYVDLLDSAGSIVQIDSASIQIPASDKDPSTSSKGTVNGANLRGIYDTLLNLPSAGHDSLVELFSISVKAIAVGQSTISVGAGSGVSGLDADFLVALTGPGDPLTGGDYSAAAATITVFNNTAPTLDSIVDATINEGVPFTFTALGHDADVGQTLTYTLLPTVPSGASINPTTGVFSWTPSESQGPGTYTVRVQVADSGTPPLTATNAFQITVNEANTRPLLQTNVNQTVVELANLKVSVKATDSDILNGQTPSTNKITYSLLDPPAGATINATTGDFSWTPTEAQGPATYLIKVIATDDGTPPLNVTNSFSVQVLETNIAPTLTPPSSQTISELSTLTVVFAGTDTDLPANTLTYALVQSPAGVALDPVTGILTWTPSEAQGPGTYPITVKVSDNGIPLLSATNSFTVTVTEANTRPILTPVADQTIVERSTLTFTNIATDTDIPTNILTFSLVSAPPGVQLNTTNGILTWTPTEAQGPGVYTISIKVADNGSPALSDTRSFTVNVTESNSPPVLLVPVNQSIAELATLNVSVFAADNDVPANTRTFGFVNAPDGMAIDPVTGAITWTPSEAQGPGTYTIAVKVTDNGLPPLSATNSFQVTVSEVNTAPISAPIPAQTIAELATFSLPITTTDNDLPPNKLTYALGSAPSGVSINSATGILTWTPTETQGPGNYNISVLISDDGTPPFTVTNTFSVTVVESNLPPVLIVPAQQIINEGTTLVVTNNATDPDIPVQALTFALVSGPSGVSLNSQTGILSWTPSEQQGPATNQITVKVSDNGTPSLSRTNSFTVIVREVNLAPALNPVPPQNVVELSALIVTNTATDPDIPANKLTYSLLTPPAGAAIYPVTGVFQWTPSEAQGPGTYTISVKVTDDGSPSLSGTNSFSVTVTETNSAPVLPPVSNRVVVEGNTLTVSNNGTDSDLPQQTLTYSLLVAPSGASINTQSGLVTWQTTEAHGPGIYQMSVKVTDNGSPALSATNNFLVTVLEVNLTPTIIVPPDQSVSQGALITVTNRATDPDIPAQLLTFSIVTAPAGVAVDPQTGVLTWTAPSTQAVGPYTITVKVSDSGSPSLSATNSFVITVNPGTDIRPTIQATRASIGPSGFTLTLTGTLGVQYIIETSPDLKTWSDLGPLTLTTSTSAPFLDTSSLAAGRRFYRARKAP